MMGQIFAVSAAKSKAATTDSIDGARPPSGRTAIKPFAAFASKNQTTTLEKISSASSHTVTRGRASAAGAARPGDTTVGKGKSVG